MIDALKSEPGINAGNAPKDTPNWRKKKVRTIVLAPSLEDQTQEIKET
jgi:hypothetical protein